jgi:glycosyltransferase involved in cell wall biosynthesis
LLGNRNDIPELLSASDVFLLPSLFEGLPYTIVEAQASGIQCVTSDTISQECAITDLVSQVPLDDEVFAIEAVTAYKRECHNRGRYTEEVKKAGFDINSTVKDMEAIYLRRG